MKVVVNEKETLNMTEYPKLMVILKKLGGTHYNRVVLFHSYGKGVLLSQPKGPHYNTMCVGEYSDSWNMDIFTPFTGSITLSND